VQFAGFRDQQLLEELDDVSSVEGSATKMAAVADGLCAT
jgi:hypothetical protein